MRHGTGTTHRLAARKYTADNKLGGGKSKQY